TRPVEHGRGRGPKNPEGTREDRQLDVLLPLGDRGGRDLPRVPVVRGAPPAEGDREGRGRQRSDAPQPLPVRGGVHAAARLAAGSRAENRRVVSRSSVGNAATEVSPAGSG